MSDLFWLSDAQTARLEPYFPKSQEKPRVDGRRVLSGIIFINRNGLSWRDAPKEYGPHKTLYSHWKRWSDKGIFAQTMAGLAAEHGETKTVMIDATYLKAHRTASSLGAKKGGAVASSGLSPWPVWFLALGGHPEAQAWLSAIGASHTFSSGAANDCSKPSLDIRARRIMQPGTHTRGGDSRFSAHSANGKSSDEAAICCKCLKVRFHQPFNKRLCLEELRIDAQAESRTHLAISLIKLRWLTGSAIPKTTSVPLTTSAALRLYGGL